MSRELNQDLSDCSVIDLKELLRIPVDSLTNHLKISLSQLPGHCFQLENFITHGGLPDSDSVSISILNVNRQNNKITVKLVLFFDEIMGGCNCSDEPHIEINYQEVYCIIEDTGLNFFKSNKLREENETDHTII